VYGYTAARSKRAERVLVPLLDILQSVPVLGFLSVTVTAFIALFRGSLLGRLNLPAGVDVFFVISGFIMLVANRRTGPGQFLLRRVIRVVPLYWVLTLALVLIALVRPELFRTTVLGTSYVLRSLLFIPYANPGHDGDIVPLLVPGWSLNFEMFFYLLFALLLLLPGRRRVAAAGLLFVTLLLTPALFPGLAWPREVLFYASPRLLEFWLGMVIAQAMLEARLDAVPAVLAAGVAALGAAILLAAPELPAALPAGLNMTLVVVLPAAAVILGVVALERQGQIRDIGWLHWLGDASYSMYLSHIFSLGVARFAWLKLGLGKADLLHAGGFAAFALACVVAGTWVCYSWIEAPAARLLQGWARPLRPRPAIAS